MKTDIPLLADVRVASPCHAAWDNMKGDEQTRFCGLCRKNVYNLSEMTRQEAENLIREKEGKLCVRYYQRTDGTVLTKDCPIGAGLCGVYYLDSCGFGVGTAGDGDRVVRKNLSDSFLEIMCMIGQIASVSHVR